MEEKESKRRHTGVELPRVIDVFDVMVFGVYLAFGWHYGKTLFATWNETRGDVWLASFICMLVVFSTIELSVHATRAIVNYLGDKFDKFIGKQSEDY